LEAAMIERTNPSGLSTPPSYTLFSPAHLK
jgi:hypothetical protein